MDRAQRVLGYVGTVLLMTGLVITAVGPAQLGIVDGDTPGSDAAGTDTPVAAASTPDGSDATGDGTASTPNGAAGDAENRTSPPTVGIGDGDGDGG